MESEDYYFEVCCFDAPAHRFVHQPGSHAFVEEALSLINPSDFWRSEYQPVRRENAPVPVEMNGVTVRLILAERPDNPIDTNLEFDILPDMEEVRRRGRFTLFSTEVEEGNFIVTLREDPLPFTVKVFRTGAQLDLPPVSFFLDKARVAEFYRVLKDESEFITEYDPTSSTDCFTEIYADEEMARQTFIELIVPENVDFENHFLQYIERVEGELHDFIKVQVAPNKMGGSLEDQYGIGDSFGM